LILKILLLGEHSLRLKKILEKNEDTIEHKTDKLEYNKELLNSIDFMISYGYKYIIDKHILHILHNKAINLHISLLPWNRGADPNLWSFIENTPKGVTIHYISPEVDKGDIIAQKELFFSDQETLRSSYEKLCWEIEKLFEEVWPDIRNNNVSPRPQPSGGSFHSTKDREKVQHLLHKGWDTPVRDIIGRLKYDGSNKGYEF